MARPKSTSKTVHTAIRLPEEVHQRLSAGSRGSLADEIKSRLEASLAWDSVDLKTRQLVAAIVHMAALVREDIGPDWSEDTFVIDAFSEAITAWLGVSNRDRDIPFGAGADIAKRSRLWLRTGDGAEQAGANLLRLHKLVFSAEEQSGEPTRPLSDEHHLFSTLSSEARNPTRPLSVGKSGTASKTKGKNA